MSLQADAEWSPADYLAFDRNQFEKYEFDNGRIVQQTGGSRNRSLISGAIITSLYTQLRSHSCSVYGGDMRVAIPQTGRYVYPDVSVACNNAVFEDNYEDTLTNPVLIIEILSPDTEHNDRSTKFQAYQTIDTFEEYLLVAQDTVLIEHFVRRSDGGWDFEAITDRNATVALVSIQSRLELRAVYEKTLPDG